MRRSQRTALLFVGLALGGYFVTSALASSLTPTNGSSTSSGEGVESAGDPMTSPDGSLSSPTSPDQELPANMEPGPAAAESPDEDRRRSYAIALHDLRGLPPDAEPGTSLELWATWRPPLTKERQVQKLVEGAFLERITPPLTPEGPPVAILSVPEKEIDELLFGDRFGDLSAAVVP
jgi:hypothetical protein